MSWLKKRAASAKPIVILGASVALFGAILNNQINKGKYLDRDMYMSRLSESRNGVAAPLLCKDWTPKSQSGLAFCKDYMILVPSSVDFNQAALTRWRDTYFDGYCGSYAKSPGKHPDLSWCSGYLSLLPESKSFVGGEKLDRWLFDGKRYQHVCYNLPQDAAMTEACSGYIGRGGLHSWREG